MRRSRPAVEHAVDDYAPRSLTAQRHACPLDVGDASGPNPQRRPNAMSGPPVGRPREADDDRQRPMTPTTTQLTGMLRSDAAPHRRVGSISAALIRRRFEAYRLPRGVRSTSVRPSNDLHVPLVGLRQGCNAESPPTCELVNRLAWSLHEGGGSLHARP